MTAPTVIRAKLEVAGKSRARRMIYEQPCQWSPARPLGQPPAATLTRSSSSGGVSSKRANCKVTRRPREQFSRPANLLRRNNWIHPTPLIESELFESARMGIGRLPSTGSRLFVLRQWAHKVGKDTPSRMVAQPKVGVTPGDPQAKLRSPSPSSWTISGRFGFRLGLGLELELELGFI